MRSSVRSFRRHPLWRVIGLDTFAVAHYSLGSAAILVAWRAPSRGLADRPRLPCLRHCPALCSQAIGRVPRLRLPHRERRLLSERPEPTVCAPRAADAGATEFPRRTSGSLCQTNLSLCSWLLPLPVALAGLILVPSWTSSFLTVALAVSAPLRWPIGRIGVCFYCLARRWCSAASVPFQ